MSGRILERSWYKAYNGMVTDIKFPLLAQKCGRTTSEVIAVWVALLERTSESETGCAALHDTESQDNHLDLNPGTTNEIIDSMLEKRPAHARVSR